MNKYVQKVIDHVKRNKAVYITGTVCLLSGGALTAIYLKNSNALVQVTQGIAVNSPVTIDVHIEALGDPGNIIQDLTTGTIYASQGQAARELGVSANRISDHLNGRLKDVAGHTFERLGKAHVTPPA